MFVYESVTVNIWKVTLIRASVIRANKVYAISFNIPWYFKKTGLIKKQGDFVDISLSYDSTIF